MKTIVSPCSSGFSDVSDTPAVSGSRGRLVRWLARPTAVWRVAVGMLVWFSVWTPLRPLMLPDEGRYVGVAWEMVHSGNWLTPMLNGMPYFHKPPLFYWITALGISLFGTHEWAMRLASVLGACLAVCSVYALVLRRGNVVAAKMFVVMAAVQPLLFGASNYANLDMLVAGCISATVVLLAETVWRLESGRLWRRWLYAAYALAGLGFLAKGLIGFVLPAAVVFFWLLATHRLRLITALLGSFTGWLVFLLVAAPWPLAMQLRYPGFAHYFFVVQHFDRFASGGFNNVQPWWFFPAILAVLWLPYLPAMWQNARSGSLKAASADTDIRWLMWIWAAVVTVFFSIPQSKLLGYILPAVVPLVYLAADACVWQMQRSGSRRLPHRNGYLAAVWLLFGGICVAAGVSGAFAKLPTDKPLGRYLAEHRRSGETVAVLDAADFSLQLYAHLDAPAPIVSDWSNPQFRQQDTWRHELIDATAFLPSGVRSPLWTQTDLTKALCGGRSVWLVGGGEQAQSYAFLQTKKPDWVYRGQMLWHVFPADVAAWCARQGQTV